MIVSVPVNSLAVSSSSVQRIYSQPGDWEVDQFFWSLVFGSAIICDPNEVTKFPLLLLFFKKELKGK